MPYKINVEFDSRRSMVRIQTKYCTYESFGCNAYAHVHKEKRRKLDDKSVKCIFIGYNTETRSYRLFGPEAKKVIIRRDVVLDEL